MNNFIFDSFLNKYKFILRKEKFVLHIFSIKNMLKINIFCFLLINSFKLFEKIVYQIYHVSKNINNQNNIIIFSFLIKSILYYFIYNFDTFFINYIFHYYYFHY